MNTQCLTEFCSAEDIIEVNKTKEYTLTSTLLLEKLLTDTSITANAIKLWQLLFNKAKYSSNLEIKISVQYMAKLLNKSSRTIFRYIKQLVEKGYLIVSNNFNSHGGQGVNSFYLRAPKNTIKQIQQTKDRAKKEVDAKTPSAHTGIHSLFRKNNPISDKLDREGDDKDVTQYNNIINITNNNNVSIGKTKTVVNKLNYESCLETSTDVVVNHNIEENEKLICDKEKAINLLLPLCKEKEKLWLNATDFQSKLSYNKEFRAISTQIDCLRAEIDYLKKISSRKIERKQEEQALSLNPLYSYQLSGERPISSSYYQQIKNKLTTVCKDAISRTKLLNEIIFEIRFGSLVKNSMTQNQNSIERAANIALKLVREGRWTTPTLLENKFNL